MFNRKAKEIARLESIIERDETVYLEMGEKIRRLRIEKAEESLKASRARLRAVDLEQNLGHVQSKDNALAHAHGSLYDAKDIHAWLNVGTLTRVLISVTEIDVLRNVAKLNIACDACGKDTVEASLARGEAITYVHVCKGKPNG
ncbi:hypothetical protein Curie_21 [Microbacterium phage Curie]